MNTNSEIRSLAYQPACQTRWYRRPVWLKAAYPLGVGVACTFD